MSLDAPQPLCCDVADVFELCELILVVWVVTLAVIGDRTLGFDLFV